MTQPTRSQEEVNRQAAAETARLYAALEALLKRHQPIDWAPLVAARLRACRDAPDLMAMTPPHHLLHSIEANCACARGQNRDPADSNRLARVMNVYKAHEPPWQLALAATEVHHFGLALYREQIELQVSHSAAEIARVWELFVAGGRLPGLTAALSATCGLTPAQWVQLCYATFAHAHADPRSCFYWQPLADYARRSLGVNTEGAAAFLSAAARTPKQVGERFRSKRAESKPQFHCLIRSAFLEAPLVDFGEGRVLAPDPYLVFRHCGQGLYRLLKPLADFDREFGDAVEAYVKKVVGCAAGAVRLLDKSALERPGGGKSCDFLLEMPDAILLVESKAAAFQADVLTEKAILQDNSTGKVVKALRQLYATAADLKAGVFAPLGVDGSKPAVGVVSTFGDLPFANTDWYFKTFLLAKASIDTAGPLPVDTTLMSHRPAVLSLSSLEHFVQLMNAAQAGPVELFRARREHSERTLGDWDGYLRARLSELKPPPLPFVERQVETLFTAMGVPSGQRPAVPYEGGGSTTIVTTR